jgi:hypothetical protein
MARPPPVTLTKPRKEQSTQRLPAPSLDRTTLVPSWRGNVLLACSPCGSAPSPGEKGHGSPSIRRGTKEQGTKGQETNSLPLLSRTPSNTPACGRSHLSNTTALWTRNRLPLAKFEKPIDALSTGSATPRIVAQQNGVQRNSHRSGACLALIRSTPPPFGRAGLVRL